jgi:hypothetical protein
MVLVFIMFSKMCANLCQSKSEEFKDFEKKLKEITKELENSHWPNNELDNNRRKYKQFVCNYSSNYNTFSAEEFGKVKEQMKNFKLKFKSYGEAKVTNVNKQSEHGSSRYAEAEDSRKNCQTSSKKRSGKTQTRKEKEPKLFAIRSTSGQITQASLGNGPSELPQVHVDRNNVDPCQNKCSKKRPDNRQFSYNDRGYTRNLKQDHEIHQSKRSLTADGSKTGTTKTVMGSSTKTDGKDEPKTESTQNVRYPAPQSQYLDPFPEKMDISEPPSYDTSIYIEKMDIGEPLSPEGDMLIGTSYSYEENRWTFFENQLFGTMDNTIKHTSVPDLSNIVFNKNSQGYQLNLSGYNKSRDVGSDEVDLKSTQVREYQDICKQIEESGPGTFRQKHSKENVKQKYTLITVEDKKRMIVSTERGAGADYLAPGVDNKSQTLSSKENDTVANEASACWDMNRAPVNRGRARQGREQTKAKISYPHGRGDHTQRAKYLASQQHKDENHHQPPTTQQNEKTQTEASDGPAVEAVEVDNSPLKILDVHQYFRNDFDLKTLDGADHLNRIERIGKLAKNFEHPIQNFAEEKHSLEYFIFDEKLMRFIENLDKIKSEDEAVTREKVQVIEYIKGLHNTLDERALDD